MEKYEVSQTDAGLQINGFPDGVKVIALEGGRAKRLADLALHKSDLQFANHCLEAINSTPENPNILREALWRSAIVHFFKCFGDSGCRFQISADTVLKGEGSTAMLVFKYFKSLRNKHLVHDENSYSQSLPGAILNNGSKDYKIEKIVCFATNAVTLMPENYSNLKLLIDKGLMWVEKEFDVLCDSLTTELESLGYDDLMARAPMRFQVPEEDDLHRRRLAP